MKKNKVGRPKGPRSIEGLPVVDSTRDLKIEILPNDVRGSKKGNPGECAAARACARKYKTEARVFLTRTYIKQAKRWVRFQTPEAISREIIAFDRGSTFEPGVYQLKKPSETQRLDYRSKPTGPRETKTGNKVHHVTQNVRNYKEQIK